MGQSGADLPGARSASGNDLGPGPLAACTTGGRWNSASAEAGRKGLRGDVGSPCSACTSVHMLICDRGFGAGLGCFLAVHHPGEHMRSAEDHQTQHACQL